MKNIEIIYQFDWLLRHFYRNYLSIIPIQNFAFGLDHQPIISWILELKLREKSLPELSSSIKHFWILGNSCVSGAPFGSLAPEFDTAPASHKSSFLLRLVAYGMHASFALMRSIRFAGTIKITSILLYVLLQRYYLCLHVAETNRQRGCLLSSSLLQAAMIFHRRTQ